MNKYNLILIAKLPKYLQYQQVNNAINKSDRFKIESKL